MCTKKQPYEFTDNITIEFLQRSYMDHQQSAEELALSEIHSMELAMPKFNTAASLNKTEFNKLMSNIKRKYKDTQAFTVIVAAITDTFTCMIQNNKFYDNFLGDNKNGLQLMVDLLQTIKYLVVTYRHKAIKAKQLEILIDVLEKCAERIQNEKEHYEIMRQIILSLRTHMQNLNKKNKKEAEEMDTETECQVDNKVEPKILHEDKIKENTKLPQITFNTKKMLDNNFTSNVNFQMNCIVIEDKNLSAKLVQEYNSVLQEVPQKPQIINKKPTNAFELMMMSSKKLAVKRKL